MNRKFLLLAGHIILAQLLLSENFSCVMGNTSDNAPIIWEDDSTYTINLVIIGSYAIKNNALKQMRQVRDRCKDPGVYHNSLNGNYYVYAYRSKYKKDALDELFRVRELPGFQNAWLFRRRISSSELITAGRNEIAKTTYNNPPSPVSENKKPSPVIKSNDISKMEISTVTETHTPALLVKHEENKEDVSMNTVKPPLLKSEPPKTTEDIRIEPVKMLDKPEQINSAQPGEVILLRNLIFYRNAAILQPSAEPELNELVSVLRENPNLNITIHGHTNGDFRGNIIKLGKKDRDYFHTSSKNEFITGDAILLSIERANIIKVYLERHGILSGRINTIGWGSVKPLYPVNSGQAKYNSRVEIEIISR